MEISDKMSWSTLRLKELTAHHIAAWHTLHQKEPALQSPFTTYEFCRAVDRTRGGVFVSILETDGNIQAFFPFQRRHRALTSIAEKTGGHMSDYFGIIGGTRLSLNEKTLLDGSGLSVFSFDHLPLQDGMLPFDQGATTYGIKVEVPDFNDYMERLRKTDKKLVKQVERLSKQLTARYGELHFQWQATNIGKELERLISEKRNQYASSGAQDALQPGWTRKLLGELLNAKDENCEAVLSTAYFGDTWVASNLALRHGKTLHIWFPVFNHELRRFGPGHILFFNLFESAARRGVQTFDFGGGTSAYKKKYAGTEYPLFKGSLRRKNITSLFHKMAESASWRIRPYLNPSLQNRSGGDLAATKSRYRARTVALIDATPMDISAWEKLHADQYPQGNAFLSPDFALATACAWPNVKACFIEDAKGIAAVLPYQYTASSGPILKAAERIAEELNDSFGLVARSDFVTSPSEILALADCNHFYFSHLAEEQLLFGLKGEDARVGLRIELPHGGDVYWEKLVAENKKFTSDSDRRARKAEQDFGKMRFRMRDENGNAMLTELMTHKRAQYLRTGKDDLFAKPERVKLLTRLLEANTVNCQSYLSTLYFGETWAAIHFGLRSRETLHYWFPVYNPALNNYAPGRLLLREVIRHAQAEGIEIIDRGEGETAAKRDFPSESRTYFSGVWQQNNAAAWYYRAQQSIKWRINTMRGAKLG